MDIKAAIRHYQDRDPGDENDRPIRERLTKPPRPLRSGERWNGTEILYSAGWLDDDGEVVPFDA